jgi:hypothetical protein
MAVFSSRATRCWASNKPSMRRPFEGSSGRNSSAPLSRIERRLLPLVARVSQMRSPSRSRWTSSARVAGAAAGAVQPLDEQEEPRRQPLDLRQQPFELAAHRRTGRDGVAAQAGAVE